MDYTYTIESVISDILEPKIASIMNELVVLEKESMVSDRLSVLRRQLKYYRLILGTFREILDGYEEVNDDTMVSLLLLCGVAPSSGDARSTSITKATVKVEATEDSWMYYVDDVQNTDGQISSGTHTFKFVYVGSGVVKLSATIDGFTKSKIGKAVEITYSTGNNSSLTFNIDTYTSDTDINSTKTKTFIIT